MNHPLRLATALSVLCAVCLSSPGHAQDAGATQTLPVPQERTTLGRFATSYAHDDAHKGRAFNVELAAQALDGKIMAPGAVLSFNDAVGERTAAFGYARATVIRDGMLAEGTGGGACQVASTLHTAALLAGLEIVARTPHSRPSAYIRMGFDATVATSAGPGAPAIDLRLRNPLSAPITLRTKAAKGNLEVWFEGPASQRRSVTLKSELERRVRGARVARIDRSVPDDTVRIVAFGAPGFRVRRTREIIDSEGVLRRDVRVDQYAATDEIALVSPAFDQTRWTGTPKADEPDEEGDAPLLHTKVVVAPGTIPPMPVQLRPSQLVTLENFER